MLKVRFISATVAAMLSACLPAMAADLMMMPEMTSPEPVAYDWTGFYLGAGLGYTSSDGNAEFVNSDLSGYPIESKPEGWFGALHAGVNQQMGMVVLGLEASVALSDITETYPDPLIGAGAPVGSTVTAKSDASGSVLGRVGLAFDRFLPYVTGGFVAAHVSTTVTAGGGDDDGVFSGWGVGAGMELALDDNWSARAQYLHSDLSGDNFNQGKAWETSSNPVSDTIEVGVNYRF